MKQLLLVRHAKSSWNDSKLNDHDRMLNKRGERDAPFMAGVLKKKKLHPDLIVSSTALRALTTAKIFAHKLDYKKGAVAQEKDLYLATLDELIEFITLLPDEKNTVMLFGHNPGITRLVNHLSAKSLENVPTCGVCAIDFPVKTWSDVNSVAGELIFFEYPKMYFKDSED